LPVRAHAYAQPAGCTATLFPEDGCRHGRVFSGRMEPGRPPPRPRRKGWDHEESYRSTCLPFRTASARCTMVVRRFPAPRWRRRTAAAAAERLRGVGTHLGRSMVLRFWMVWGSVAFSSDRWRKTWKRDQATSTAGSNWWGVTGLTR